MNENRRFAKGFIEFHGGIDGRGTRFGMGNNFHKRHLDIGLLVSKLRLFASFMYTVDDDNTYCVPDVAD